MNGGYWGSLLPIAENAIGNTQLYFHRLLTNVLNRFTFQNVATKSKLKPRQCRLKECRAWFVPSVRSQIYHDPACSLKARQARFWKETRKARKLLAQRQREQQQASL